MHEQFPSSKAGVVKHSNVETEERLKFWRFCSAVLGIGLLVALMTSSGPRSAGASEVDAGVAAQPLRVGGFDQVDGQGMFVIENADGERVGLLPLANSATEQESSMDD